MKVSFTAMEYGRLLELVHLGLWVAGSRPDDPETMPERYHDIAQKVFALAEPLGCADLVETDVNGEAYPAAKLIDGPAAEKLERYAEDVFWTELVSRLALRDYRQEHGIPPGDTEEIPEGAEEQVAQKEDAYWREFEAHGVDHLVLLRGGRG